MQYKIFVLLVLIACSGATSSSVAGGAGPGGGGTDGGGATDVVGAGGYGGGSNPPDDPLGCLDLFTEQDCIGARCAWHRAWLFDELSCGAQVELHTCLWFEPFQYLPGNPIVSRRDVAEGLLVTMSPNPPFGFTDCDFAYEEPEGSEPCACLD